MEDDPFPNASNEDQSTHLPLSSWLGNNKHDPAEKMDRNDLSDAHQRLSMDGSATTSSSLSSVTGVGVCGDICEDEEEDTNNFVSTLDVDAIKVFIVVICK